MDWQYSAGAGGYRCRTKDQNGTGRSVTPAARKTVPSNRAAALAMDSINRNFQDYLKSVYREIGRKVSGSSSSILSTNLPISSQASATLAFLLETSISTTTIVTSPMHPKMTSKSRFSTNIRPTKSDEHRKQTGYYKRYEAWFTRRVGLNVPVLAPSTTPVPFPSPSA
jgi:hypothetical protein